MFESFVEDFRPYHVGDLLAKIGALSLLPENASRSISLNTFGHVVASIPYDSSKSSISLKRIRSLIKTHIENSTYPRRLDDPAENLFTTELIFHGGSFIVFPGYHSDSVEILRWLLESIVLSRPESRDTEFRNEVIQITAACLKLSDQIARNAGLSRGVLPSPDNGADITVPASASLNRLARAVRFDDPELASLFTILEPLISKPNDIFISELDSYAHGTLQFKPIIRVGAEFIIPQPSALLVALRHRILTMAEGRGLLSQVTSEFHSVVWEEARRLFSYLKSSPVSIELPNRSFSEDHFSEGIFTLDTDKAIYAQLITDPLSDFVPTTKSGSWNVEQLGKDLQTRQNEVVEFVKNVMQLPGKILIVTLMQGMGNFSVLGIGNALPRNSLALTMSVSDLETITLLEADDPLALWKFAIASDRVRSRTEILSMSILDEYELYRSQHRSYYLSDQKLPNLISIVPGGGLQLKIDGFEHLDYHGISSYTPNRLIEVWHVLGDGVPIYVAPSQMGEIPAAAVDGVFARPFWIVGPPRKNSKLDSFSAIFCESVAYWLWQFEPFLSEPFEIATQGLGRFVIRFDYSDTETWERELETSTESSPTDGEFIEYVDSSLASGEIYINLKPALIRELGGSDNAGERKLLRQLLLILRNAFAGFKPRISTLMTEELISDAIEIHAPLGLKKKLMLLPMGIRPEADPRAIPPFRKIQEPDWDQLFDQLATKLQVLRVTQGSITSKSRKNEVLQEIVAIFFQELEQLVAKFTMEESLASVISFAESNTRELSERQLMIPARLACFGQLGELVESLTQEIPEIHSASNANRFLVEYIAARPPNGSEPMSLESYDTLLAIAAQIIHWASLSDLIHFEITDISLSVLPSGRLGAHHADLTDARGKFLPQYIQGEIGRNTKTFLSSWRISNQVQDIKIVDKLLERMDDAFIGECGFSLTDLEDFLFKIHDIGAVQEHAAKRLSIILFKRELGRALGWSSYRIGKALEIFSLRARDDFLHPDGFSREEVYPWRFNRSLSYMRRPLIIYEMDEVEHVVWGNRHLIISARYLFDLAYSGRLKAKSKELKEVISKVRNRTTRAFEDEVADHFRSRLGTLVRSQVEKFGSLRMLDESRNKIGDVDVFVAVPDQKIMICIECKDLAFARTPRELQNQLTALFKGTDDREPTTVKHLRRIEWIEDHIEEVCAALSLPDTKSWKIQPLLISDDEMYTPYLSESPFPVYSFERIRALSLQELVSILTR